MNNYFSFLSSPVNLLFIISALFLIFGSSYIWNSFEILRKKSEFLRQFHQVERHPWVIRILFFLPLLLASILIEYYWPINSIQLFPIFYSPFIRWNSLGIIIGLIGLIVMKHNNKNNGISTFGIVLAYIICLYLLYLIIYLATLIVGMNAFPHDLFSYSSIGGNFVRNNAFYLLFLLHLILVWFIVPLRWQWKLTWVILYFCVLSFANFANQARLF